ncbi:MAG: transcription antitermination factor NusB [Kofleriaceae bacterium]
MSEQRPTEDSRPVTSREVARRVLDRVTSDAAWATPALDGELARAGLDDRDRRLASELVYGVLRHRARIDRAISAYAGLDRTPPKIVTVLRVAAYQILLLDRVPGYAAVDDAVDAANVLGAKLGGFVNAVLRKLTANGEPALPVPGNDSMDAHLARMEVEHSTPRWILDELAAATRDEVRAALATAGNAKGVDATGVDAAAVAATGNAKGAGVDATGVDATGVDATGVDAKGVDAKGVDATGVDAKGVDANGAKGSNEALIAARIVRIGELARAFAQPAPIIARVNARRATRDEVIAELEAAGVTASPIASAPMALRLEELGDPSRDKAFMAGRWTVQDTGAQLVGLAVARMLGASSTGASPSGASPSGALSGGASPSGALPSGASPSAPLRILDACAGVGGKSTHLAELFGDDARIDAADLNPTKLALGRETAARLGLANIHVHVCDLLDPAAPLGRDYDLVVLDAPCTGLGVLRRHPDAKWRLRASDVKRLAELQRMLLDAVVPRIKPGGILLYSVCTFTRAEGPEQVAALVKRSALELVAHERSWPPDADAFYLATLRAPA